MFFYCLWQFNNWNFVYFIIPKSIKISLIMQNIFLIIFIPTAKNSERIYIMFHA